MALTQVVEHHLPTYASLAFVEQKWEWEKNLNEIQEKEMKMQHAENATQSTSFIFEPLQHRNVQTATRGQLGDTLMIPLQSLSVFVLGPLQGNQVLCIQLQNFRPPSRDGGGWEQPCGVIPAEVSDSWEQLTSAFEKTKCVRNRSSGKLDQLTVKVKLSYLASRLWRAIEKD